MKQPTSAITTPKRSWKARIMCSGLAWLLLVMPLITSCHSHDDPEPDPTVQTILWYFPWSGNDYDAGLYYHFRSNITEVELAIKERKTMANARLLVCLASRPYEATLFEIKYEGNKILRDTLVQYSNINFTSEETILRVINDTKGYAPALRYGMMIGCHGLGWVPASHLATARQAPRRRYFGGEKGYRTDITTLASAISNSNTHMDFILFDDCYMANIEVAYDLRHVTDHLIASTSEIMARGLPYQDLWAHLSPTPQFSEVCNSYYDFYSTYTYPYGTLAAIDCREIEAFAALMRQANETHTLSINDTYRVQQLDGYAPAVFFDCGDYIAKLCADDPALVNQLNDVLQRLVPSKVATKKIFSVLNGSHTIDVNTFSGITISDPTINTDFVAEKTRTAWWQATH